MTSPIRTTALRLAAALSISAALAACDGAQAPTPISSPFATLDAAAICQAAADLDSELEAITAAALVAAEGGGFELASAEQRTDEAIAALEGLALDAQTAAIRDGAVEALRNLQAELPDPSADTSTAVADAVGGFRTVLDAICG